MNPIEFLEEGPSSDPGAAVLLFALTLVLEGTIGPAIAAAVTRAAIRPLMRGAANAVTAQARRDAGALAKDLRFLRAQEAIARVPAEATNFSRKFSENLAEDTRRAAEAARKDLRRNLGEVKKVRDALARVTDFAQNNLVAGAKGGRDVANAPGSKPPPKPAAAPGVELRAAAMASASRLRLTAVAVHEAQEAELKRPGITLGEAQRILRENRDDAPLELAYIRENFQLATEAMIWAKLLLPRDLVEQAIDRAQRAAGRDVPPDIRRWQDDASRRADFPAGPFTEGQFLRFGNSVDENKKQYVLARFRTELERWITENDRTIPIRAAALLPSGQRFENRSKGSLPPGWWETLKPVEREDFLVQYLAEVEHKSPGFEVS